MDILHLNHFVQTAESNACESVTIDRIKVNMHR